ncbi:MAG: PDZ domain-containing protein [Verrucomicrobiota bacterium]
MKKLLVIAFFASQSLLWAEGSSEQPVPQRLPHAPRAWLGLDVTKPDETITAHIPTLPAGIGFIVRYVEKEGPGEAAGLQVFDVLWKINDQLLVNEGQLAALLRLFKPGDEVSLAVFRGGKPTDVKLKFGDANLAKRPVIGDLAESSLFPGGCSGPIRRVDVAQKIASYSTEEGRAEVRKDGEAYKVKITGPKEELIFEGNLAGDSDFEKVPREWNYRIYALRRGLDLALDGRMMPTRQHRPRVVPPVAEKP